MLDDLVKKFSSLDPQLQDLKLSSKSSRQALLDRSILSVSGLRFICSDDENDLSTWAQPNVQAFVLVAAHEHAKQFQKNKHVCLGMDSRPTGPLFLLLIAKLYHQLGLDIRCSGIAPIPEIMAATHQSGASGFCYMTASHNPPGHNGLKLGLEDGAVLSKEKASPLIENIKKNYLDDQVVEHLIQSVQKSSLSVDELKTNISENKAKSLNLYQNFALDTVASSSTESFTNSLQKKFSKQKSSFIFDMNGSSRLTSCDLNLLNSFQISTKVQGDKIGVFQHAIVPEGDSLNIAKQVLQDEIDQNNSVIAAMVPDCDGDRGNLILPIAGTAQCLKAQETFALCALSTIAGCRASGYQDKLALVVNGPSSFRLESILKPFDVKVVRAEVGEANVLNLAEQLREQGYLVPISGEGSNGGSILMPSTVRDPLMTLLSLLKFLYVPIENIGLTTAEYYLNSVGKKISDESNVLESVLESFPTWHSTDAFDNDALMPVPNIEHETLKQRYESAFISHFDEEIHFWQSKGVASYKIVSYEGTENIPGPGNRPSPGKGGLAILLLDSFENALGFLWMRGSGTEPVFRVVCDWSGNEKDYLELLRFHRQLIESQL